MQKKVGKELTVGGEAPPVGGGKVVTNKYTIFGLDYAGAPVGAPLDPRIVVTEP